MTQMDGAVRDFSGAADTDRGPYQSDPDELSAMGTLAILLRYLPLLVWLALAGGLAAVALAVVRADPHFISVSTFTSASAGASGMSRYAGLAAQFGINVPTGGGGESLSFYAKLLRSPTILHDVARTPFELPREGEDAPAVTGSLADVLEFEGGSAKARAERAAGWLDNRVTIDIDPDAGILTLNTTAPRAALAQAINRRLLELVEEFNGRRRKSQAAAERTFVEARLAEAGAELRAAENEMLRFMERNRNYSASPQLSFEAQRLDRQVLLRQEVYRSLAQAFEQARLEEIHNMPVITVIDEPSEGGSVKASLVAQAGLGMFVGLLLALGLAFGREALERQRRRRPVEFRQLTSLVHSAIARLVPSRSALARTERALNRNRAE